MDELRPWLALLFRRPGRLINGGLLMLVTLISGIGLLALSGWFITATALTGLLLAAGVQASINLYVPGGGIRFFAVSRTIGRYLERLYNHDTVLRLLSDIRVFLFRQLAGQSAAHRGAQPSSRWLSRFINDVDQLDALYLRLVAPPLLALLLTLIIGVVAFWVFGLFTAILVSGLLVVGLIVATVLAWWTNRHRAGNEDAQRDLLRSHIIEHLDGMAELKAAGRAGRHGARLMRIGSQITRDRGRSDTAGAWIASLTQLLVNLAVVAALWAGLTIFQQDLVSGPLLVLLPLAVMGLGEIYSALPEPFSRLGATIAAAGRINEDCRDAPSPQSARTVPDGNAALVMDKVQLKKGQHTVLNRFNLSVNQEERIGITGRSGVGKSTLAEAMAGLVEPSAGQVRNIPLAFMTQETVIMEDSLAANLRLGAPEATDEMLWRALETVELRARFSEQNSGLETWLGNAGRRLSGGEARRVALARVLLSPAELVVLDEPFTGVDPERRERIARAMEPWLKGRTLIALGHGVDALPPCDRIVSLD
jgi:ATP-binding cassette subfamily C protein CydC